MSYIEMKNIYKVYPPDVIALEEVNFSLQKEKFILNWRKWCRKSTLMKILYGLVHSSSGQIYINGNEVKINSPSDAINFGIGMVHQEFMLIPSFKVYENVILGMERTKIWSY